MATGPSYSPCLKKSVWRARLPFPRAGERRARPRSGLDTQSPGAAALSGGFPPGPEVKRPFPFLRRGDADAALPGFLSPLPPSPSPSQKRFLDARPCFHQHTRCPGSLSFELIQKANFAPKIGLRKLVLTLQLSIAGSFQSASSQVQVLKPPPRPLAQEYPEVASRCATGSSSLQSRS